MSRIPSDSTGFMQYRTFGATGRRVSVFTLGCMRFPHGWDKPHDHLPDDTLAGAAAVLNSALGAGINLLETARGYGKSEWVLGRVLPTLSFPRESYQIMTKAPPAATAGEMRRWVEDSLERMGVDRVELFAVHGINNQALWEVTRRRGGPLAALERLRDEGVIGNIGFSTHAPAPLLFDIISSRAFEFINLHYTLLRPANRAVVELAAARGMGVLIISPNDKGGRLYEPPERLRRLTAPLHPVVFNQRWLLSQPEIHTLSIGMSEPDHLDVHRETLAAVPPWGETEREINGRMQSLSARSAWERCGGCTRCLPCPERINIPELLRWWHLYETFDMTLYGQYRYGIMEPESHWMPGAPGDRCNDCGECLPRCPLGLPIPQQVRAAHQVFFQPDGGAPLD